MVVNLQLPENVNGPIPNHILKEHHKISNIPKFRCKILQNADNIALRSLQFSVILDYKREMVTTSVRNTK